MSREPSRPARLRDVCRIVVVGDSITELGAEPGGYVSLLEHALAALDAQHPIEIVNAGISGDRSPDMFVLYTPFRQVIAVWRQHAGPTTNLLTTDGVHLNAAGNHLMAATILRELDPGRDTGNHPGLHDGV
jgi:lysophospholipase L1-like esterase